MSNSAYPDQGMHCLPQPVFPKTLDHYQPEEVNTTAQDVNRYLSLATRKSVFGDSEQVALQLTFSATESS